MLAAVLVIVAGVLAAPTSSAAARDHLGFLDRDAAVLVRIDLDHLERSIAATRRTSSAVDRGAAALAAVARARAGFDPLTAAGWRAAGFDPARPVFASALALDAHAAETSRRRGSSPSVSWRSRVVLPLADAAQAEATARRLAGLIPGLHEVASGGPVLLAGQLPGTGVRIVASRRGDAILLDVLTPRAGTVDHAAARRAAARTGSGAPPAAARSLAGPGIAIWTSPDRVLAAFALAERPGRGEPQPATIAQECGGFLQLAERGALADLELRLLAEPGALRARARWAIREGSALAAHLEPAESIVVPPAQAQLLFAWTIDRPARLAALPRPPALDRPSRDVRRHAAACGPGSLLVLWAFGWPELAGAFFDQLARVGPRAGAIAGSVGPGAGAVRTLGPDIDQLLAAIEIAAREPADVLAQIDGLLDVIFGARRAGPTPTEKVWGKGRLRPYRRSHPDGSKSYGSGRGGRSIDWFVAPRAPRQRPPEGAWAWLRMDGGRALAAAASSAPGLARWLDRGPRVIGPLEARATSSSDTLAIELRLGLRVAHR
jgi:hypothetical protein